MSVSLPIQTTELVGPVAVRYKGTDVASFDVALVPAGTAPADTDWFLPRDITGIKHLFVGPEGDWIPPGPGVFSLWARVLTGYLPEKPVLDNIDTIIFTSGASAPTTSVTIYEAQINTIRSMTGVDTTTFPDATLAQILAANLNEDNSINLDRTAADIFEMEAARFARLVDVSESGSSRKLSDLHKNALGMAKFYGERIAAAAVVAEAPIRPRTRRIVRRD